MTQTASQPEVFSTVDNLMTEAATVSDAVVLAELRSEAIGIVARALLAAEKRGADLGLAMMSKSLKDALSDLPLLPRASQEGR